jgi:hypothetical protein
MANQNPREKLENRALGALLTEAFFAWPSAVLIALFLILFLLGINLAILPFWQRWMWLVVGVLAEAAYLYATVTDPEASRRAVSKMLVEKYDPRSIRNNNAREQLTRALEYRTQIDKFVEEQSGALKVTLAATASDISDWVGRIYNLAKHIDMFEANTIINRDRQNVPTEIANLKRRLAVETDPAVKAEIQEAISIRQNLLSQLDSIGNTAKRAELQMENTIAQLSTVYAQMQLIDARDLDSGRAKRIQEGIREEIAQLSDTLSAMDDIYKPGSVDAAISNLADTTPAATDSQGTASTSARRSGTTQR